MTASEYQWHQKVSLRSEQNVIVAEVGNDHTPVWSKAGYGWLDQNNKSPSSSSPSGQLTVRRASEAPTVIFRDGTWTAMFTAWLHSKNNMKDKKEIWSKLE